MRYTVGEGALVVGVDRGLERETFAYKYKSENEQRKGFVRGCKNKNI